MPYEECPMDMKENEGNIKLSVLKMLSNIFIPRKIDLHAWDEDERRIYLKDLKTAEKWIKAFPLTPEFSMKSVIDIGCGNGALCTYTAMHGARKVFGVESKTAMCDSARSVTYREYPEMKNKISFVDYPTINSHKYDEQFDIVLSQAAFEHYDSPEEVLERMIALLKPGGYIYAAFSPLWNSFYGSHLKTICPLPWAHLWGGDWLIKEHNRLRPHDPKTSYKDLTLNQASLAHFEKIFGQLDGCELVHFFYNRPIIRQVKIKTFLLLIEPLRRLSFLREYLTHSLVIVVKKRD